MCQLLTRINDSHRLLSPFSPNAVLFKPASNAPKRSPDAFASAQAPNALLAHLHLARTSNAHWYIYHRRRRTTGRLHQNYNALHTSTTLVNFAPTARRLPTPRAKTSKPSLAHLVHALSQADGWRTLKHQALHDCCTTSTGLRQRKALPHGLAQASRRQLHENDANNQAPFSTFLPFSVRHDSRSDITRSNSNAQTLTCVGALAPFPPGGDLGRAFDLGLPALFTFLIQLGFDFRSRASRWHSFLNIAASSCLLPLHP